MSQLRKIIIDSKCMPWLSVIVCWLTAFILSCMLSSMTVAEDAMGSGLAKAAFRGARQAVSTEFAATADEYFHRGVTRQTDLAFTNSFFQKITSEMAPGGHFHLEGNNLKESMPWYWMAIKMDPHNIENYLVAAFWVAGEIGDNERAHEILQDARRNTNLHHEIELEDAIIYMHEQKLNIAEKTIDTALRIWPSGQLPDSEEAIIAKIHILSYKALLREIAGDRQNAARYFRSILLLTPDDENLKNRIAELEKGSTPSRLAKNILNAMVQKRGSHDNCSRGRTENKEPDCEPGCGHNH